ncbi:hypothetical protein IEQ34_010165 [Dendrobium chrysotoxum]|uniref:mannan endo-1,4-beta-mannosidase n=1 Tax=Dendrobium chrysotoxum TaxID=161865 RepID=A0AAV7H513_DENCH|nr:hypothetical protein IEQ34_010165 [Dendrobium chrysotoxum]
MLGNLQIFLFIAASSFTVILSLNLPATDQQRKSAEGIFIKVNGTQFVKDNQPFYINGLNAYWLMSMASEPTEKEKVSIALHQASLLGANVVRTWAFSDADDYFPLQTSPGFYNEKMFKGLDFVISEAKKNGLLLILSLVNNNEEFGGKEQYVQWAREKGQPISSSDDFFTNDLVKRFYKHHVKTILMRKNSISEIHYRDDPTILAWELINEPRCNKDISGDTLQAWIEEMSSYVKTIDNNHLLEIGLEGFYGDSIADRKQFNPGNNGVGTDFISNNLVPGIDFATIHIYPEQWIPRSNLMDQLVFLQSWIHSHIRDSDKILNKPLLITEFGRSIYSYIYASAKEGGAGAGSLFWQLLVHGQDDLRDGYEVIISETPSLAFIVYHQSQRLLTLSNAYAIT